MSTVENARGLRALVGLLLGSYATGTATVKSTGATGKVPAGSFAIPVVDGQLDEQRMVVVAKNPASADGSWDVAAAGSPVGIEAVQGGVLGNLPAATVVVWDPPLDGIEARSAVGGAAMAGGVAIASGGLKQLVEYRALGTRDAAQAFFTAQLGEFPGAVLTWSKTMDGYSAATEAWMGPRSARLASDTTIMVHEWLLYLVTSRLDGEALRRTEGAALRDSVVELINYRKTYRGLSLSSPRAIQVVEVKLEQATPSSFIDSVRFQTMWACKRANLATWNDWLKSRLRRDSAAQAPDGPIELPDVTVSMAP